MLLLAMYLLFLPLFSSVDPVMAADAAVIDYADDDTSSFSAELPSKPPLDHSDIAHSILSHACIRFCYCYCLLLF